MKILIKNGRIIDPSSRLDREYDILIENKKVVKIGRNIKASTDKTIDATSKLVMPGIVDMHVHLREPGREDKETIATGSDAALKGGVTSVVVMPNTNPCVDSLENLRFVQRIIKKSAKANIFIAAAITQGRLGKKITDIAKLKKHGIVAISDDGDSVDSSVLLHQALKKAKASKVLTICHCEDRSLSGRGVVNLGPISTKLGLRGISKESEYKRVARDIELAKKAKASIHIAHVSCQESIELIAQAKKKGIKLTAEAAPHHFSLTEESLLGYDTNMKMNPPLRTERDIDAIKKGLKDGTIDVIASDHAPHTESEKEIEFDRAEFGVIGLETALAVSITELVHTNILDWSELARKLSYNPAKILGLNKGSLGVGHDADIIVVDPNKEWLVKRSDFISRSKNSCFVGRKLKGVVEHTICGGQLYSY